MVMAWRFGAVSAEAVTAAAELFEDWVVGVPTPVNADRRWPEAGSVVPKDTDWEPHGRHAYDRRGCRVLAATSGTGPPPAEWIWVVGSG